MMDSPAGQPSPSPSSVPLVSSPSHSNNKTVVTAVIITAVVTTLIIVLIGFIYKKLRPKKKSQTASPTTATYGNPLLDTSVRSHFWKHHWAGANSASGSPAVKQSNVVTGSVAGMHGGNAAGHTHVVDSKANRDSISAWSVASTPNKNTLDDKHGTLHKVDEHNKTHESQLELGSLDRVGPLGFRSSSMPASGAKENGLTNVLPPLPMGNGALQAWTAPSTHLSENATVAQRHPSYGSGESARSSDVSFDDTFNFNFESFQASSLGDQLFDDSAEQGGHGRVGSPLPEHRLDICTDVSVSDPSSLPTRYSLAEHRNSINNAKLLAEAFGPAVSTPTPQFPATSLGASSASATSTLQPWQRANAAVSAAFNFTPHSVPPLPLPPALVSAAILKQKAAPIGPEIQSSVPVKSVAAAFAKKSSEVEVATPTFPADEIYPSVPVKSVAAAFASQANQVETASSYSAGDIHSSIPVKSVVSAFDNIQASRQDMSGFPFSFSSSKQLTSADDTYVTEMTKFYASQFLPSSVHASSTLASRTEDLPHTASSTGIGNPFLELAPIPGALLVDKARPSLVAAPGTTPPWQTSVTSSADSVSQGPSNQQTLCVSALTKGSALLPPSYSRTHDEPSLEVEGLPLPSLHSTKDGFPPSLQEPSSTSSLVVAEVTKGPPPPPSPPLPSTNNSSLPSLPNLKGPPPPPPPPLPSTKASSPPPPPPLPSTKAPAPPLPPPLPSTKAPSPPPPPPLPSTKAPSPPPPPPLPSVKGPSPPAPPPLPSTKGPSPPPPPPLPGTKGPAAPPPPPLPSAKGPPAPPLPNVKGPPIPPPIPGAPGAPPAPKGPPPPPGSVSRAPSSSKPPQVPQQDPSENLQKLKPLHWDKVRADPSHSMVWDRLRTGSFELNEDEIAALFGTKPSVPKDAAKTPMPAKKKGILDSKKAQNIAIQLRALNISTQDICDALLEGGGMKADLLEVLVKMTPTQEEQKALLEFSGDRSELGPAERFLKSVLEIPNAFQRVQAMLYRACFKDDLASVQELLKVLEAACVEVRENRLFLKLLEAVLKTGNRMNKGTNRGEAEAFKLDTLLRLSDVKSADGKTTLLHFVAEEIIKSEGLKAVRANNGVDSSSENASASDAQKRENEIKRKGLEVVWQLCTELGSIRNAAGVDADALNQSVLKLASGLSSIQNRLKTSFQAQAQLSGIFATEDTFSANMEVFCSQAESDVTKAKEDLGRVFDRVKQVTAYFHGSSRETQPLRLFIIVRDFISMLEKVCKDLARPLKMNLRG